MRYLFVLFMSLFLMGADCEQQRLDNLDEGREVDHRGDELCPWTLPWEVYIDQSVYDEEYGFDEELVFEAIDILNDWIDRDGVDRTYFVYVPEMVIVPPDEFRFHGSLVVGVGHDEWVYDDGFPSRFSYGERNGQILFGLISVSYLYTYDRETVLAVLLHEFGHALALADDPGTGITVDLNSFMGDPLVYDGDMTDHDFELVTDEECYVENH